MNNKKHKYTYIYRCVHCGGTESFNNKYQNSCLSWCNKCDPEHMVEFKNVGMMIREEKKKKK